MQTTVNELLLSFDALSHDEKRTVAEEISRRFAQLCSSQQEDIWAGAPPIIADIRRAFHADPFQPFILHLVDGRELLVENNLHIAIAPYGRYVAVALKKEKTLIDFPSSKIERLEVLTPAAG